MLWPVHIFMEGEKWRLLLQRDLSPFTSALQVLSGYSTAIWTPGQWGHFVGRKWHIHKHSWGSVTGKTLLSGFWQSWAYVGLASFSLWVLKAPNEADFLWQFFQYLSPILSILGLLVVFLFAERLKRIESDYFRNKVWNYFVETLHAIAECPRKLHWKLLILSVLKAVVVYVQFGLLMNGQPDQWLGIPLVFMALTLLPLPPMLGMIARGELILQIWHWLEWSADDAYASIYLLWMINVLFSAFLGTLVLLTHQKAKNNE